MSKKQWLLVAGCVLLFVLLIITCVVEGDRYNSAVQVRVVGTYGGVVPGEPSLVFDPTEHYALIQDAETIHEGQYRIDERLIIMDSGSMLYYALYMDNTIYLICDGQPPTPYLRSSEHAMYLMPPGD